MCVRLFYFNLDGISFSSNADRWWISFIDSFLRPCVPLFIMASAYLLVPLKDSTPVFFKRRFTRVCIPFVVWGASLCLFTLVVGRSRLGQRENPLAHVPLQFPVQRHTSLVCVHVDRGLFLLCRFCLLGWKQVGRKEELFFFGTLVPHYILALREALCAGRRDLRRMQLE